jgi:hypothetical protein
VGAAAVEDAGDEDEFEDEDMVVKGDIGDEEDQEDGEGEEDQEDGEDEEE